MAEQTAMRDQLAALIDEHSFQAPSYSEGAADAVLAAGWRPPARRIEGDAELHAVPRGTVVRAADGTIACRYDPIFGVVFGDSRPFSWAVLRAPATVLFDPTLEADRV